MLNDKLDIVVNFIDHLDLTIKELLVNAKEGGVALVESLKSISKEISAFRSTAMIKRH